MSLKGFTRSPIATAVMLGLLATQAQAQSSPQQSADAAQQNPLQQRYTFNFPKQRLLYSLGEFTATTQIAVVRQDGQPIDDIAPALQGEMTADEALRTLLADSSLTISYRNGRTAELLEQATSTTVGNQTAFSTLTVSADRIGDDWVYHEPRSVSVISREQIDRLPPRHAADMLVQTPGVTSSVSRHDPGLSVNIRGMQDFGRVNMMIDGMRQNYVESGHQQRNGQMYVDSDLLSDVIIEKGPNAGVHGANAIAGSANFRTINLEDVVLPGNDVGVRFRGNTGVGGEGNGVNFIGSIAVAGRVGDNLELVAARSHRNLGEYSPGSRNQNLIFQRFDRESHEDLVSQDELAVNRLKHTGQTQDSSLFKSRWIISDDQELQFSYIGTELSYNNVSDRRVFDASGPGGVDVISGEDAWNEHGEAEASSDSFAFDYSYNPDNPLIDLHTKFYFVNTENRRVTNPPPNVRADNAWESGMCSPPPNEQWEEECAPGLRNTTHTQTDTIGFQFDNTSNFELGSQGTLSANYGVEWFQDKGKPNNTSDRDGRNTGYFDQFANSNVNPHGRRDVASAFSSLTWERPKFTLGGGLRYDYYRLRGETTVPYTEENYESRMDRFMRLVGNSYEQAQTRCAEEGHSTSCRNIPIYEQALADPENSGFYNRGTYDPEWLTTTSHMNVDVDREDGQLSPFLNGAYRPNDWLELFAGWGQGWRPPALTETLWEGGHPSDSFSHMFPNPLARPERSTSWEIGANVFKRDVLIQDDQFAAKLSYFDTRVDDYLFTSTNNAMPGAPAPELGMGNTAFVNNLAETKFRGLELELNYDAGNWYTGLNYTHMLDAENEFCQQMYYLGSQMERYDQPNEDGTYPDVHYEAIEAGYDSAQDMLDNRTRCHRSMVYNSARTLPNDRGSAYAGMRFFNQDLDIGVRANYAKEILSEGFNDYASYYWPSYLTWDLYASYRLNQHVLFRASVENVRDENYLTAYSDIFSQTYAPGRAVQAGVEIRF